MKEGTVTATVQGPDADGFVWLSLCDRTGSCTNQNLGRSGEDVAADIALRARRENEPARGTVVEERLASIH